MSLVNIVPRNNYSSLTLRMVICNEDGPPDDQNQKDGRARIVANDHLDDLASSVPHFVIIIAIIMNIAIIIIRIIIRIGIVVVIKIINNFTHN